MEHALPKNAGVRWFLQCTGRFRRWWPTLATVGVGLVLTIGLLAWMPNSEASWRSWSILIVGLAVTCLAAAASWLVAMRQDRTEHLLAEQTKELRAKDEQLQRSAARIKALCISHEDTIHQLMKASLCRNQETGMHIRRIGLLSEMLALAAGWSHFDAQIIRMAAPLHDAGMIGIPDTIMQKPGKLTAEEFEIVKKHTLIGARILEGAHSDILAMAHKIALYHHERWDGTGYPHKLSGQQIPEAARIVSIVDVFDAVSHDRAYRAALPAPEVQDILTKGAGSQFDPNLVRLFMANYETAYRIARENPDEVLVGFGASYFLSPAPIGVPIMMPAAPDVLATHPAQPQS